MTNHQNYEAKAKITLFQYLDIRKKLSDLGARYLGLDEQTDTYGISKSGTRKKFRQSKIDGNLVIEYNRENKGESKLSNVNLGARTIDGKKGLEDFLRENTLLVTVKKKRHIYFVENVKIHLDLKVEGLDGPFLEVEAIDTDGKLGTEKIKSQCDYFLNLFGIKSTQHISGSYSDMLLEKQNDGAKRNTLD